MTALVEEQTKLEEASERYREPWNILPAVIIVTPIAVISAPLWLPGAICRNSKRERIRNQYDAHRLRLGMSESEITAIVGAPERARTIGSNRRIAFHGHEFEPDRESSSWRWTWIAVEYEGDRVVGVFSHDFFDERLLSDGEEVRHQ